MWDRGLMKKAAGLSYAVDGFLIVIDVSEDLKSSLTGLQTVRNNTGIRKPVKVYRTKWEIHTKYIQVFPAHC